jgi:hypothetical protein
MKKFLLSAAILFSPCTFAKDFKVNLNGILDFSSNVYMQKAATNDYKKLQSINDSIDFA